MPSGRRIEPWIAHKIAQLHIELKWKHERNPTSTVIHNGLHWEITKAGQDPDKHLPSKRYVQEILRKVRTNEDLQSTIDPSLNGLWSIGVSAEYAISPEANPLLLSMQRWCNSVGHRFTIHEALWANRLRTSIPDDLPVERKHHWAWLYTIREKTSMSLGVPMDTRDMDAFLTLRRNQDGRLGTGITPWTYDTAVRIGVIPELSTDIENDGDPTGKRARYGWGNPAVSTLLNLGLVEHTTPEGTPWIIERIGTLPDYEAAEIYALWLNHMSNAAGWPSLYSQRVDIADRLITWVAMQSAPPRKGWYSLPNEEVAPRELLEEVGLWHEE
tara:strand:+ start:730 stop:1713 length:984 start_codon:yes stop_codon:yes gene_type:complete